MNAFQDKKHSKLRRGWTAGEYLLSFIILTGFLLIVSCGEDDKGPTAPGENEIVNNLTFTRHDETTMSMGTDYAICCGIWEPDYIDENALKVLFYDSTFQASGWKLFILVDDAVQDTSYSLPTEEAGQSPLSMFVWDLPTGNELGSNTDGSSGTITINSFSCGPPVTLDVTMNATIGSEYGDGPSVTVTGTFNCTIHINPSPFGCEFSM